MQSSAESFSPRQVSLSLSPLSLSLSSLSLYARLTWSSGQRQRLTTTGTLYTRCCRVGHRNAHCRQASRGHPSCRRRRGGGQQVADPRFMPMPLPSHRLARVWRMRKHSVDMFIDHWALRSHKRSTTPSRPSQHSLSHRSQSYHLAIWLICQQNSAQAFLHARVGCCAKGALIRVSRGR